MSEFSSSKFELKKLSPGDRLRKLLAGNGELGPDIDLESGAEAGDSMRDAGKGGKTGVRKWTGDEVMQGLPFEDKE